MVPEEAIRQTQEILESLKNKPHWFLAFSGGKDSTALLILTVEFLLKRQPPGIQLDILYADTRLEIPPMARHAAHMLQHVRKLSEAEGLPIRTHIVRSPPEESFWVLVLGKGYPLPGFHFRWCTDRLKVRPMRRFIRSLTSNPDEAVVLIGVRNGESRKRDQRLLARPRTAVAPLLHWKTSDVRLFLTYAASNWGWPTEKLLKLYSSNENVRYGCWICPLVRKDRAVEAAAACADEERQVLEVLASLREKLLAFSRSPENREIRPDGRLGRLTLEARQKLFRDLLAAQALIGRTIVEEEEVQRIFELWRAENDFQ